MITVDFAQNRRMVKSDWDDLVIPISIRHIQAIAQEEKTIADLRQLESSTKSVMKK